jgi:hypothetical protein
MPLLAFWASNPKEVSQSTIEQIVAMAGDGVLKDGGPCSAELREYLKEADSAQLEKYIEHCLSSGFAKSGLVFQDLVNELGRRLDYNVINGRYQGTQNSVGFDGIWSSPQSHTIVTEVKTTDAYTVKLDTIATYRQKLLDAKEISHPSSILIVVGRQDTGELEAQIRGSRHAWDIRLISADALLKLVKLKENSEDPDTGLKIRSLLTPMEFTRLDSLVDVMFTTATDVESGIVEAAIEKIETPESPTETVPSGWQFTDAAVLDNKRNEIIDAMSRKVGSKLIKKSRATYWDADHAVRVACSISKRYTRGAYSYWYAYHPKWDTFLGEAKTAYFVLGCMDLPHAFAIPLDVMRRQLEILNTTTTDKNYTYWHVHLIDTPQGVALVLPTAGHLSLDEYRVQLEPVGRMNAA